MLVLPNGEQLSGKYLGTQNGLIQFETEFLGVVQGPENELEVLMDTQTSTQDFIPPAIAWHPPTPSGSYYDGESLPGSLEDEKPDPQGLRKWLLQWFPNAWEGELQLGFTSINSESSAESLDFGVEAKHIVGSNEYRLGSEYDYGKQVSNSGETSKTIDRYSGNFRWSNILNDTWSVQTRSIYLKDMLRDINHSATQSLGLGYAIAKKELLEFEVTPAMAGRYIDATGFEQHWLPLATVYESFIYHINSTLRIEQEGNAEYNPGQPVEYAYDLRSGIMADLNEWVEAGLFYEYNFDNIVGEDADKIEERILVQLGIPF